MSNKCTSISLYGYRKTLNIFRFHHPFEINLMTRSNFWRSYWKVIILIGYTMFYTLTSFCGTMDNYEKCICKRVANFDNSLFIVHTGVPNVLPFGTNMLGNASAHNSSTSAHISTTLTRTLALHSVDLFIAIAMLSAHPIHGCFRFNLCKTI